MPAMARDANRAITPHAVMQILKRLPVLKPCSDVRSIRGPFEPARHRADMRSDDDPRRSCFIASLIDLLTPPDVTPRHSMYIPASAFQPLSHLCWPQSVAPQCSFPRSSPRAVHRSASPARHRSSRALIASASRQYPMLLPHDALT
jgi:hypothetical protein